MAVVLYPLIIGTAPSNQPAIKGTHFTYTIAIHRVLGCTFWETSFIDVFFDNREKVSVNLFYPGSIVLWGGYQLIRLLFKDGT